MLTRRSLSPIWMIGYCEVNQGLRWRLTVSPWEQIELSALCRWNGGSLVGVLFLNDKVVSVMISRSRRWKAYPGE